jgi:hypothetical protein
MTDLPGDFEITLIMTTDDRDLATEVEAELPTASVSASDNFLGGTEIAAFLLLAKETIGGILGFLAKKGDRVKDAKISIGTRQISLEGYSAGDAERLMGSQAFKDAVASVKKG